MRAIASQLESIVGHEGVCSWEMLDAETQERIRQAIAPGTTPPCIVYPATQAELQQVMQCAYAEHWRVLPMGSGSKISWGGLVKAVDLIVSTARLNQVIDHAIGDLTITAEAGLPYSQVQALLNRERQFLAIDPTHSTTATLGGIVATADAGSWRQRYGGVRDMLIGLSIVRYDGQLAKAGGRVVKNVAGYDLMKLLTGSYGTLGIISQVTFRLYPQSPASCTVVLSGAVDAIATATRTILTSALTPTMVDLVMAESLATVNQSGAIALVVRFESVEVSIEQQAQQVLALGQALHLQGISVAGADETALWERVRSPLAQSVPSSLLCKVGVEPATAAIALDKLRAICPDLQVGAIHAASGIGLLRILNTESTAYTLLALRQVCQEQSGFLSVLEAPPEIKQNLDVWGYTGNALSAMKALKHQFDPENLLSPHRFVSGI